MPHISDRADAFVRKTFNRPAPEPTEEPKDLRDRTDRTRKIITRLTRRRNQILNTDRGL